MGGHYWQDASDKTNIDDRHEYYATQRNNATLVCDRWFVIQHELIPELKVEVGALTPKLEKVIHTLDWVRINAARNILRLGHQALAVGIHTLPAQAAAAG